MPCKLRHNPIRPIKITTIDITGGTPAHIKNFDYLQPAERDIVVRSHCFACTSGDGSSCQGALTD